MKKHLIFMVGAILSLTTINHSFAQEEKVNIDELSSQGFNVSTDNEGNKTAEGQGMIITEDNQGNQAAHGTDSEGQPFFETRDADGTYTDRSDELK